MLEFFFRDRSILGFLEVFVREVIVWYKEVIGGVRRVGFEGEYGGLGLGKFYVCR